MQGLPTYCKDDSGCFVLDAASETGPEADGRFAVAQEYSGACICKDLPSDLESKIQVIFNLKSHSSDRQTTVRGSGSF